MSEDPKSSMVPRILLPFILVAAGVVYGFFAGQLAWFPARQISYIYHSFVTVFEAAGRKWYQDIPAGDKLAETFLPDQVTPGLVMVTGVNGDNMNFVRVIERDGSVVHEVIVDWFNIWGPDEGIFSEKRRPQQNPGAVVHGVAMLPDGDIVLNYEWLSTMRLSPCGEAVWKLDNNGHHSVDLDDDGNFWVSAAEFSEPGQPTPFQNMYAPLTMPTAQKISPDGKILETISIIETLRDQDLLGLLHMASIHNTDTGVFGDTLHPNDVEIYPAGMPSEIFSPGDIMLSLRNINTVLVLDGKTHEIKFRSTGHFLRQHDPNFVGDDKIMVYDNRNVDPSTGPEVPYSRIALLDARTGDVTTYFKGEGNAAFYSRIMGKTQLLDNGHLMISSPNQGRVFEVDGDGNLVWQYYNLIGDGYSGVLTQTTLLPENFDKAFFERLQTACKTDS